jgi:hypothetical protein
MNKIKLKSTLKFWQEIVFIISIGILVCGITINNSASFQHIINIVFYCIFVSLLVCLVGQFYWKSLVLGILLSIVLGLGSIYMIFAVLSDLAKISNVEVGGFQTKVGLIFGLFLFIGLTVTAITMPVKYDKKK